MPGFSESWVSVPPESDFPIQNLPFGIFEFEARGKRPAIRIGDFVLDLEELGLARGPVLNGIAAQAPSVRRRAAELLDRENPGLRDNAALRERALIPVGAVTMHVPFHIGDYVDFYSSLDHASNVGKMFRDPANPLLPNWRHLPVAYHGKSGTVAVGGAVRRPMGQISTDNITPVYAPSRRLDFELETGFFLEAPGRIFGMVLLNDWSARDIQRWEYQPLGPFLSKSFATSISPWVVTLDALTPFRAAPPPQDPPVLPHLAAAGGANYDIHLEVWLQPGANAEPLCISRTNFQDMYWTMDQQVAHLRSNGAPVRTGDLCGSGTISGPEPGSFGSLLELAWNGTKPIRFPNGAERSFLEDGDTVIFKGWCQGDYRIGFGELRVTVLSAEPVRA